MVSSSAHSSLRDEDLLALIQRRQDHAAFQVLVGRHAARYRALAYRYTHRVEDAEDIVQEAFLTLWRKPELFNPHKGVQFTTWFHRLVVNRCLDLARKKKPCAMPEHFDAEDDVMAADELIILNERTALVEQAFRQLPVNMQQALNLSFYDPVPNKEAAEIMNLSVKAFQSLLMRAKAH